VDQPASRAAEHEELDQQSTRSWIHGREREHHRRGRLGGHGRLGANFVRKKAQR
jgi:hypothetical protein